MLKQNKLDNTQSGIFKSITKELQKMHKKHGFRILRYTANQYIRMVTEKQDLERTIIEKEKELVRLNSQLIRRLK